MSHAQSAGSRSGLVPRVVVGAGARTEFARAARFTLGLFLFGIVYYATARATRGEVFERSRVGLIWVPNALFLSALILTQRRSWWMILAAASAAHVLAMGSTTPAWRMAWQIPVNATFVIATTEALRRFSGFPLRFEKRRKLLIFLGVALVMPVLLALTAPGFVRSITGAESWFTPAIELVRLTSANSLPLLLITPAVLQSARILSEGRRIESPRAVAEAATIIGSVLIASFVVFYAGPELARAPWLLVLTFPPLIWAAVRLGPTGSSASLLLVAVLSILGAARKFGPFVAIQSGDILVSLELYWIAISLPVMLLATVIAERKQAEHAVAVQRSQLAEATRIATARELSGSLAHELRQSLTAILANARAAKLMLARQPHDVSELRATLSDIEQEDQRAASVITHLRLFLKGGHSSVEPLDITAIVRDALALSTNALALARVEVHADFATDLPSVQGNAVQLLQIVLTLIENSCDAMTGIPCTDRRLRVTISQPDHRHAEIIIRDSGRGLPNGSGERVFAAFFTTKPEGLGLGLPIARSIAKAHGGRLWGENNPGGGSAFHLLLPVEPRPTPNGLAGRPSPAADPYAPSASTAGEYP